MNISEIQELLNVILTVWKIIKYVCKIYSKIKNGFKKRKQTKKVAKRNTR